MSNADILFQPFKSEKLSLKNRIVMAPMTRQFSPGCVPGEKVRDYYERRARGGVGLIITEGTTVDQVASSFSTDVPAFHGEDALAGWKKVVDAVHAAGGKIAPQLWHVGTMRKKGTGPHPEAESAGPSGLFMPGKKVAEPMTKQEIQDTINAFASAAEDAKRLGFDAVEVHGAHGYLIDQFFWEGTNQRDDEYGGDLVNRTKFAADIVRAIREKVGPDFPIILRYSQWKQQDFSSRLAETPEELAAFLQPLVDAGVDIFHCSTRRYWEPEFEGAELNLAGWTKKLTAKPSITVGSVGLDAEFIASMGGAGAGVADISGLVERMENEEFDLVAVGRALISNPEWANLVQQDRYDELQAFSKEHEKELV